jgi:hypothetical protein
MRRYGDHQIWKVRPETNEPPQQAVDESRYGQPVLVVGSKQVAEIPGSALCEQVPFVRREPDRPTERDEIRQSERLYCYERG